MRLSRALLICVSLLALPVAKADAQRGAITGIVSDTLGTILENVQVMLMDTKYATTTDSKGAFKLTKLKPGRYTLSMKRLGFAPFFLAIDVGEEDPAELQFELTPAEVKLSPVAVESNRLSAYLRRVGFESRRKTSGVAASHFVSRYEIAKLNPTSLSHVVERMTGRSGSCTDPNVYMDGVPAFASESRGGGGVMRSAAPAGRAMPSVEFSKNRVLDYVPPKDVDGMEVYSSVSEIPAEYKMGPDGRPTNKCVVLLWTRER